MDTWSTWEPAIFDGKDIVEVSCRSSKIVVTNNRVSIRYNEQSKTYRVAYRKVKLVQGCKLHTPDIPRFKPPEDLIVTWKPAIYCNIETVEVLCHEGKIVFDNKNRVGIRYKKGGKVYHAAARRLKLLDGEECKISTPQDIPKFVRPKTWTERRESESYGTDI